MTGIFENDGALDWLNDFTERPDLNKMISAFRLTGDSHEYPDALDCEEALAAAAVVISLKRGIPLGGLPHEKFEQLQHAGLAVDDELLSTALHSVKHIYAGSELKDLWEEDELYPEWELSIKELLQVFLPDERV